MRLDELYEPLSEKELMSPPCTKCVLDFFSENFVGRISDLTVKLKSLYVYANFCINVFIYIQAHRDVPHAPRVLCFSAFIIDL